MPNQNATFDFIIIGAGSAGCVLANRLSANPAHRVLLLEAGPSDWHPAIHLPGGCAEVIKSSALNWKFQSTPQAHLGGRQYDIPRGKTLGGSSSANGMVYIRGNAADYDSWAAAGNSGWAYRDVLPAFRRLEDFCRGADAFHGVGGGLKVSEAPGDNPLYERFIAAGIELGFPINNDFNGACQEGFGRYHATLHQGKRCSSAVGFLHPVRQRKNLSEVTGATVTRILLEGSRAVGVEYRQKNRLIQVQSGGEVILSAGTINSPHILQLSGIGDEADLLAAGITPRVALPGVGKNLQDHLDLLMRWECTQPISLNGLDRFPANLKVVWDYLLHKRGIAACNNIEAGAFIRSEDDATLPDIQLHFVPCNMTGLTDRLPLQHGVTVHACNLRPQSRGTVKAVSADPFAKPMIDFCFLDNERDRQLMLSAFRFLRRLMAANAWQGLIGNEISPGIQLQSDDEILRKLGSITETVYHPVGSCKMGSDPLAVVDAALRVHGVSGLRVADASIMPTMIGGNTNAPSMMIGEKCAEMVL
jgi:choline dehydrogenase